jgi:hypothetical protein
MTTTMLMTIPMRRMTRRKMNRVLLNGEECGCGCDLELLLYVCVVAYRWAILQRERSDQTQRLRY